MVGHLPRRIVSSAPGIGREVPSAIQSRLDLAWPRSVPIRYRARGPFALPRPDS